MLKKGLFILLSLCLLSGCKPSVQDASSALNISLITPNGAPALAVLDFMDQEGFDYSVVSGSDVLNAEFTNAEKDYIIAPINLGVKMIDKGADYKLLSVITWGNLYLVCKNPHLNVSKVAAFGEGAVPGKVLNSIQSQISDIEFIYFNNVQETSAALLAGQYDAAVLAEPYLTMTNQKWLENHDTDLNVIYDIQELYSTMYDVNSYPQAALFVRSDLLVDKTTEVIDFANRIKSSIDNYNSNQEALKERIQAVDLSELGFASPDLVANAYPKMALELKFAYNCVDEINAFLSLFNLSLNENHYVK